LTSDKVYCELNASELQQLGGKILIFLIFFWRFTHENRVASDEIIESHPIYKVTTE